MTEINLVDRSAMAHIALSPLRRQILGELGEPASATEVADRLGLTRQKVNYHLSVLESHSLAEVTETRQRRGFEECLFLRRGKIVLAPDLIDDTGSGGDDMSAEAIVAAATDAIRAVGSLDDGRAPHPTATMITDVTFATPSDLRHFLERCAVLAAEFDNPTDGLTMRVGLLAHVNKGADR